MPTPSRLAREARQALRRRLLALMVLTLYLTQSQLLAVVVVAEESEMVFLAGLAGVVPGITLALALALRGLEGKGMPVVTPLVQAQAAAVVVVQPQRA